MNMKEYAEKIVEMAKKYPEAIVIYAVDEEGNGYDKVQFEPCIGRYDLDDHEFYQSEDMDEKEINAVCIN